MINGFEGPLMTELEDQIVQSLRRIVRAIDVHSRELSREYESDVAATGSAVRIGAARQMSGRPTGCGDVRGGPDRYRDRRIGWSVTVSSSDFAT